MKTSLPYSPTHTARNPALTPKPEDRAEAHVRNTDPSIDPPPDQIDGPG
jgi:hypothetical protein